MSELDRYAMIMTVMMIDGYVRRNRYPKGWVTVATGQPEHRQK